MTEYRNSIIQPSYYCTDCFGDNFPICFPCIEKCHQNHNTKKIENQHYSFICKCGSNSKCTALHVQTLLNRNIDETRMNECYEEGICSKIATGRNYTKQKSYICLTCNESLDHYTFCKVCIEKCHQGHKIEEISNSHFGFFCDCEYTSCKCKGVPKMIGLFNPEQQDSSLNKLIHILFLIPKVKLMILKQEFKEEILKELKLVFEEMARLNNNESVGTIKIERLFYQYIQKSGLSFNFTDMWRSLYNLLKKELNGFKDLFKFELEIELECKDCNLTSILKLEDDYFSIYLWNVSVEDGIKKYIENKKESCQQCSKMKQVKSIDFKKYPSIMMILLQDLNLEQRDKTNIQFRLDFKKFSNESKAIDYDLMQILTKNNKNNLLIKLENQWVKCGKYNTYFNINNIKELNSESILVYKLKSDEKIVEEDISIIQESKKIEMKENQSIIYHVFLPEFFQIIDSSIYIPLSMSYFYGKGKDYFHIKLPKNEIVQTLKDKIESTFNIYGIHLYYLQYGQVEIANIVTPIFSVFEKIEKLKDEILFNPIFKNSIYILVQRNYVIPHFKYNIQYDNCLVCLSCNEFHDRDIYPWKKYEGIIICMNCALNYPNEKVFMLHDQEKFKLNPVKKNYINVLPDEIILQILFYVSDKKEKKKLRLVSFQWNYLIQNNFKDCSYIPKETYLNINLKKWEREETSKDVKRMLIRTTLFGLATVATGIPLPIMGAAWFYNAYSNGYITNLPNRVIQYGINELKVNQPKEKKITSSSWVDIESSGDNFTMKILDVNEPIVKIFNLDCDIQDDYFNENQSKIMIPQKWDERCDKCNRRIVGTKYLCQDCLDKPEFCENCFTQHLQYHYFKLLPFYSNQ